MEKDKYYTPNISEFHVGFEYELKCFIANSDIQESHWKKSCVPSNWLDFKAEIIVE